MDYGVCRDCKAQVMWVKSAKTGKPMILDPQSDSERGNVIVDGAARAHVFADHAAALAGAEALELEDEPTWLDHHVTCPEWEKRRAGPSHSRANDPPAQVELF